MDHLTDTLDFDIETGRFYRHNWGPNTEYCKAPRTQGLFARWSIENEDMTFGNLKITPLARSMGKLLNG